MRAGLALALGVAAIALAMLAGRHDLVARFLEPPGPVRALLTVASVLLGCVLVVRSAERLRGSQDAPELVRGVRLVFLAVAAFAAAAGWFVGSAVPIVAALVIAGVDLLETTFLLLVTVARRRGGA